MSRKRQLASMWRVIQISYKSAPSILYLRVVSSLLDAGLPIATAYFAAQTATQLAEAYNGNAEAGQLAIIYVLITAVIGIIATVWRTLDSFLSRLGRYKLSASVNDSLIGHFLSLDYWRYDDSKTVELFDKAKQFSTFFAYLFDRAGNVFSAVISLIGSVAALAFVSWWLALLMLIAIVPSLVIQFRLSKLRVSHWQENIVNRRKMNLIEYQLTEIGQIAELRLYGLVKWLVSKRRIYRDQDEKVQILIERRYIWKEFFGTFLEAAAELAALVYVTLRIISQSMPIGQFLYVQQIVSRGLGSVHSVASSFIDIDEELANLEAYNEFLDLPIQNISPVKPSKSPESISLRGVTFGYPRTDKNVLHNVSLDVKKGEHIAIVGENGSGKSTIIKLLLGLYLPTTGSVLIDEVSTAELDIESWHSRVGVLQQESVYYEFTDIKDNIVFGDVSRPFSQSRYDSAIKLAEAEEFISKLPKKEHTLVNKWMEDEDGESGTDLSGGQKQRLALARNFYRDSPVIILDEPTSAIDALAESRIFNRLFAKNDKIIITVSHRLTTVRRAHKIFVLEDGRIVESGSHQDLVNKKGAYYRLFESQL